MEILSPTTGRAKVVLTVNDTINFVAQPASYSIQRSQGNYVQAVFVDDNAGARGNADIVDSVQPDIEDSENLSIPPIYGPTSWPDNPPSDRPDRA